MDSTRTVQSGASYMTGSEQRWADLERLRSSHPMVDAVIDEIDGRRIRIGNH